jgi:AcrR family transcriptional regulator
MVRWQPDARQRLERAALELFLEQGFATTTVPEITARAGLTTRTFFRHFSDKREVLFADDEIPQFASRLMAEAPASLEPMALVREGLKAVAETRFEGRRDEVRAWRGILRSDQGLLERDLRKRAEVSEAVREGLLARGVTMPQAALFADVTVTVLHVALEQWLDEESERPLFEVMLESLATLRGILSVD